MAGKKKIFQDLASSWQASRVPLVSPAALPALSEHWAAISGHCSGSCKWRQGLAWHVWGSPGKMAFGADQSFNPSHSMLLMNSGCTDTPLWQWMHIGKCQSNMKSDTRTCFCNCNGFHLQEANKSLKRFLQAEQICYQMSPWLLFHSSWTKITEAKGSVCISLWEKGRPSFVFYAPESHLLHGGEKYAVVLGAVHLHWEYFLYLVFCHESYTSDNITIPLATIITWYKEEQTVHLKGGNVVPSRKKKEPMR